MKKEILIKILAGIIAVFICIILIQSNRFNKEYVDSWLGDRK